MGFTTGLVSVPTSLVYLGLLHNSYAMFAAHDPPTNHPTARRSYAHLLGSLFFTIHSPGQSQVPTHITLSQQSTLLNSVIEPLPSMPEPPAYEVQKAGMVEMLKDRWNSEVENMVRRAQTTDWDKVRESWESRVGSVWARVRESEAGERFKENVAGIKDSAAGAGENFKKATEQATHEATESKRLLEIK